MFDDTIADWQSLTKLYGEMSDEELLELDAQLGDLTEMAQQVLRDEMKKRGLSRPRPADNAPTPTEHDPDSNEKSWRGFGADHKASSMETGT